MLDDAKARSVSITQAAKMSAEELEDKIVTGILHDDPEAPEFQSTYAAISAGAQKAEASRKGRPRRAAPPATEPVACGLPSSQVSTVGAGAAGTPAGAAEAGGEDVSPPDETALPCEGGE